MMSLTHLKSKLVDSMTSLPLFAAFLGKRWFSRWKRGYILAEKELSIVPSLVPKNSIFFDIGANRGELSYFFATACDAARVFAFEPQKRMFNVLRGVASKQTNIEPRNIALSDSAGQKTIHIPVKTTGRYTQAASFETNRDGDSADECVQVDTLDNFAAKNGIKAISFIKCDTEGHELAVFRGAMKILRSLRPLLYIEIKQSNKNELVALLKGLGYDSYQPQTASENYFFYPIEKGSPFP